jgi:TonB-dependent starch-binding outer membrane protein SusC
MKKNCAKATAFDKQLLRKLIIMSKLCLLLLTCSVLTLQAGTTYGQQVRINLEMKNASLSEIIAAIKQQTEFEFAYDSNLESVQVDNVSVNVQNEKIDNVLSSILEGTDINYKVIDKIILLSKNNLKITSGPESKADNQLKNITGTVTDEKGNPLAGVTITVQGTTFGTLTDASGKYIINNATQNAILIFSFVGMATQEILVSDRILLDVTMKEQAIGLNDVVVIGYGTIKKKDLTGSITTVKAESFKTQTMAQASDMLAGTIAGFNSNQGTTASGGASMEIRGPKSLSAGTNPLIVLDGVIFNGSLSEINPYDIVSVDVLKDASSAAVFGSKAASGVIIITTAKGSMGKPTINFSTKIGISENNNQRRGLGPEAFIQFREDYLRQINPNIDPVFYTNPNKLPSGITLDQWRALSPNPLADDTKEWMARIQLYPEEQANYLAGKTMDAYDYVFRKALRQDYDLSISGGTDVIKYYWSIGDNNNEGILVGDKYSNVRSRLNLDFKITDWLNAGINSQFSDRNENSVPADYVGFYSNSPYGEMFQEDGSIKRLTDGHTSNPLLAYYRTSLLNKTNSLFANMYAEIKLPLGIRFKVSYQPRYETNKYGNYVTISDKLGGMDGETPTGERSEYSNMNWMVDNLLTWKKEIGMHSFDVTLLANMEKNQYWSTDQTNKNFQPNQVLGYHGMQYGDSPGISSNDVMSTGDAYMARLNYAFRGRYLFTASLRRDGYSAFGTEHPRATFPAFALAWVISDEKFFKVDFINRMKLRFSWGVNGNRDIGIYSALANTSSILWYDGTNTRIGVQTSSLANAGLRWERTESLNLGLDIALMKNRVDLTADIYKMATTDLLMNRVLPRVTGFGSIMSNLGELGNRGFEMTLNTINVSQKDFTWKSGLVFSLNRNKINKLFGDIGSYTLLGKTHTGELPDYSNEWFPGQALDVVWDYKIIGIWQKDEAVEAAKYNLEPGDFKAVDVNGDGKYVNLDDKKFIGYTQPRYRLGLRNDFNFLKNFTVSIFIRADLGQIGAYRDALNDGWVQNDCQNRNNGPVPYWTADNPSNEYARLNTSVAGFGGGLMIYKPRSFVRVQDISITYNLPQTVAQKVKLNNMQVFVSVRNLATFTKWPGWDPESPETTLLGSNVSSGMTPMPRTYTLGLNFSL